MHIFLPEAFIDRGYSDSRRSADVKLMSMYDFHSLSSTLSVNVKFVILE